MSEIFDFGFTAVTEQELESYQTAVTTTGDLALTQVKLNDLYNAIQPLLNNLKANPEKEYILWPDRAAKVEEFQDHLDSIYNRT